MADIMEILHAAEERQRIESLRDEGFGQYVTAENIQDYLAKLQGGRQ